ncbi:YbaB/EbfC family nucleoid-associated protein [Catellatospora tritici]|uniref:YbaB/EbfC family nucleoid-associated protein n=1 Tax=Catellatospora tritici TaxID=2851566 RepID=UPI001C2D2D28|nr:YbaB/EbfC family nucleoid-associated protein [Catellatospora tritici]MBV1853556.1 YbaB/EbfC family nucleoid-associated protein [Catellatospora tritici]
MTHDATRLPWMRPQGELVQALTDFTTEFERVTGHGTAADGLVEAWVDHTNALTRLTIDPRLMRGTSSVELADSVLQATAAAGADLRRQLDQLVGSAFGVDPADVDPLSTARDAIGHIELAGADLRHSLDDIMNRVRRIQQDAAG